MKKCIALVFLLFAAIAFKAQQSPVTWMASYKASGPAEGEILITALIEKNWHTYSQRPNEAIPIPTSFTFTASKNYVTDGKTEESNAREEFEKAFDARVFVFTDKAEFKQKIKITGKPGFTIAFKVEFICCNDNMCLPPKTVELSVKVPTN